MSATRRAKTVGWAILASAARPSGRRRTVGWASAALLALLATLAAPHPAAGQVVSEVWIELSVTRVEEDEPITASGALTGMGDGPVQYRWIVELPAGGTWEPLGSPFSADMAGGRATIPEQPLPNTDTSNGGLHTVRVRVEGSGPESPRHRYTVTGQAPAARAEYRNPWYAEDPPFASYASARTTPFGGSTCRPGDGCPGNGTVLLSASAFGQPLASTSSWDRDVDALLDGTDPADQDTDGALEMLYPEACDPIADPADRLACKRSAAYRYERLIYAEHPIVPGEIVNQLEAGLATMDEFYGDAERARARDAETRLREALLLAPLDARAQRALLDLYRDRAVAETALAQDRQARAMRSRLPLAFATRQECEDWVTLPVPAEWDILVGTLDDEIDQLRSTLGEPAGPGAGGFRSALAGYLDLLGEDLGVDTRALDPAAPDGIPYGYYLFQQLVPERGLLEAAYLEDPGDADSRALGVLSGGEELQPLFSSYGDVVVAMNLLADQAEVVAMLSERLAFRNLTGDRESALALVGEAQRRLHRDGALLLQAFADRADFPPAVGRQTLLPEAMARWRGEIARLRETKVSLETRQHPLGFADDFLLLIDRPWWPGSPETWAMADNISSYDQFHQILVNDANAPLVRSRDAWCMAAVELDDYQAIQPDLQDELAAELTEINRRLRRLTGVEFGDPADGAKYNDPCFYRVDCAENGGYEIWQQWRSIESARDRIRRNGERLDGLLRQVQVEIERLGEEAGYAGALAQVYVDYGDGVAQAKITEEIADAGAAQAAADEVAGSFSLSQVLQEGGLVAAGISAGLERRIGDLEARKERFAARQTAEIADLRGVLLDDNDKTKIKTWLLEADLVTLDSAEAAYLIEQGTLHLARLLRERDGLVRRWDDANEGFLDRYHADLLHRRAERSPLLAAEWAFREAQRWVFFAARALEYKWNTPFSQDLASYPPPGGGPWTLDSLYRLRAAPELWWMLQAMDDFDDGGWQSGPGDTKWEYFSVREDFFGYRKMGDGDGDTVPEEIFYTDPDTGEEITAEEAFRRHLRRLLATEQVLDDEGTVIVEPGDVVLEFSTVREWPRGLKNLFHPDEWLDKINWMKLYLVGTDDWGITKVSASLTYGGTSYIRNQVRGTPDPGRADHLRGEMTAWSTRWWYKRLDTGEYASRDALRAAVDMYFTETPRNPPPSAAELRILQERSTAASGWRLVIPTEGLINLNSLDDIEIQFEHFARVRP